MFWFFLLPALYAFAFAVFVYLVIDAEDRIRFLIASAAMGVTAWLAHLLIPLGWPNRWYTIAAVAVLLPAAGIYLQILLSQADSSHRNAHGSGR